MTSDRVTGTRFILILIFIVFAFSHGDPFRSVLTRVYTSVRSRVCRPEARTYGADPILAAAAADGSRQRSEFTAPTPAHKVSEYRANERFGPLGCCREFRLSPNASNRIRAIFEIRTTTENRRVVSTGEETCREENTLSDYFAEFIMNVHADGGERENTEKNF